MPRIPFNKFTGGMTDFPLDASNDSYQAAQNMVITPDERLGVRAGSSRDNETFSTVPDDPKRIGLLIPFSTLMLKSRSRDIRYVDSSGWQVLTGVTGNPVLGSASDTSEITASPWNKHVFITSDDLGTCKVSKIYKDNSDVLQVRTAGLPQYATTGTGEADVTITSAAGSGANSYGYAFIWSYSYLREGNVEFIDRGSPSFKTLTSNAAISGGNTVTLTDFITFSNGAFDNYDTRALLGINLEIYRTVNNGSIYYKVAEVEMATLSVSDNITDANLVTREPLYTTGGIAANDAPPVCRYLHMTESFGYYAYIEEDGEVLSNTIRQSKAYDPDSVPASFFVEIDDDIVGISSVRSVPIVLGTRSVYRLDGFFADDGSGGIKAVKISDNVGGVNQNSLIQTIDWLYFAGTDGFYRTNGFTVEPLSKNLTLTYRGIVSTSLQRKRLQGAFDPEENRLFWACSPENGIDNDTLLVAHMDFYKGNGAAPFTLWNGQRLDLDYEVVPVAASDFSWTATAIVFYQGRLWRAQRTGQTFIHFDTVYSDERLLSDGVTWTRQPILYDYRGPITSFGDPSVDKWTTEIAGTFENVSNISAQIQVDSDQSGNFRNLPQVLFKDKRLWGDSYWGDPTLWTANTTLCRFRRYMPPGSLRGVYKQVRIRSAFAPILSSDERGHARLTAVGSTYTLSLEFSLQYFLPDCPGYYVKVQKEKNADTGEVIYSDWIEITAQPTSGSVQFVSSAMLSTGTERAWKIWGFFKGDTIKIQGYSLLVDPLGGMLSPFRAGAA